MANAFIFIRMDFLSYGYGLVWFGLVQIFQMLCQHIRIVLEYINVEIDVEKWCSDICCCNCV